MYRKGITLIETVVYIGLIMIVLPSFVIFILQLMSSHTSLDSRSRMEQTASFVLSDLQRSITEADAVNIGTSTLSNDNGVLKFLDDAGQLVTIDRPTAVIEFGQTEQSVNRLRIQKGTEPAFYLTDPEINVTKWRIEPIRDSESTLTGLRISFDLAMLNPTADVYRQAAFAEDVTLSLSGQTVEN